MDFCSIFTIARVGWKKGEKYEGYYLLEVFLIGGNLTELCLYVTNFPYEIIPKLIFRTQNEMTAVLYFPSTQKWEKIIIARINRAGSEHRIQSAELNKN